VERIGLGSKNRERKTTSEAAILDNPYAACAVSEAFAGPLTWEGKQDNKSIAELDLMNTGELALEGLKACHRGVALSPLKGSKAALQQRLDAVDYIETIQRVYRKKRKMTAALLMAFTELQGATLGTDLEKCSKAYDKLK